MVTIFLTAGLVVFVGIAIAAPHVQQLNQTILDRSPSFVQNLYRSKYLSFGHPDRRDRFWIEYQRVGALLIAAAFAVLLILRLRQ